MYQKKLTKRSITAMRIKRNPEVFNNLAGEIKKIISTLDVKYIDNKNAMDGLMEMRDLYPQKNGYGTIHAAVVISKAITLDNYLPRETIKKWVERGYIRGRLWEENGKLMSSINLDDIVFWTRVLRGFEFLENKKIIRKTQKSNEWKYLNSNQFSAKGVTPAEMKAEAVIDILSMITEPMSSEDKENVLRSILGL